MGSTIYWSTPILIDFCETFLRICRVFIPFLCVTCTQSFRSVYFSTSVSVVILCLVVFLQGIALFYYFNIFFCFSCDVQLFSIFNAYVLPFLSDMIHLKIIRCGNSRHIDDDASSSKQSMFLFRGIFYSSPI